MVSLYKEKTPHEEYPVMKIVKGRNPLDRQTVQFSYDNKHRIIEQEINMDVKIKGRLAYDETKELCDELRQLAMKYNLDILTTKRNTEQ